MTSKPKKKLRGYISTFIASANAKFGNEHRDRSKEFFGGDVTPQIEKSIKETWRLVFGDNYEILVVHLNKSQASAGLGFSVKGKVDVDESSSEEGTYHHYIRFILGDGPVGKHGVLRIHDELLEANGKKLYGERPKPVLTILKELPTHVRLVCARRLTEPSTSSLSTTASEIDMLDASDLASTRSSNMASFKAKSQDSLFTPTPTISEADMGRFYKARSEELLEGIAMWSTEPLVVELEKKDKGLGFSVAEHEDPMNPSETVIVIHTLVPGGVAHLDGRIFPGDRLLFVNDKSTERCRKKKALEALQACRVGWVTLGIAKPLPLNDSMSSSNGTESTGSPSDSCKGETLCVRGSGHRDPLVFQLKHNGDSGSLTPRSDDSSTLTDVSETAVTSGFDEAQSAEFNHWGPTLNNGPLNRIPSAPAHVECTIKIKRHTGRLGIEVDPVEGAKHGCRIRRINDMKVRQDGRLAEGDYLTAIKKQTLRHVTSSQADEVIGKIYHNNPTDIQMSYIQSKDVQSHVDKFTTPLQHDRRSSNASSTRANAESPGNVTPIALLNNNHEKENHDKDSPMFPPSPEPLEQLTNERRPSLVRQDSLTKESAGKSWTAPRRVTITKEPNTPLGFSIVGCKAPGQDDISPEDQLSEIFVQDVVPGSPAYRSGQLNRGDKILEVNGTDVRNCVHDNVLEIIRNATSPVQFLVQSLAQTDNNETLQPFEQGMPTKRESTSSSLSHAEEPEPLDSRLYVAEPQVLCSSPVQTVQPESIPDIEMDGHGCEEDLDDTLVEGAPLVDVEEEENRASEDEDRASEDEDSEKDAFGYTKHSIVRRYGDLGGEILLVKIPKIGEKSLGIQLSGNKDPRKMSVFVCGVTEGSLADNGQIKFGDQLLEVNGEILNGRSHVNAVPIIRKCHKESPVTIFVIRRNEDTLKEVAVNSRSLRRSPSTDLQRSNLDLARSPSDSLSALPDYSAYGEVYQITLHRGPTGLGFFIMDSSFNYEPGIYVKQITANGVAHQEGTLRQGDRLLAVNGNNTLDMTYDATLEILRNSKGEVRLVVGRQATSTLSNSSLPNLPPPITNEKPPIFEPGKPSSDTTSLTSATNSVAGVSTATIGSESVLAEPPVQPASTQPVQTQPAPTQPSQTQPAPTEPVPIQPSVTPVTQSVEPTSDPKTCPIVPGKETLIEISKDKEQLGLSIVGGSDTILGTVIIHEVYETGAAARDGRLWSGDRILAVNEIDLRAADHEKAIQTLRSTGNPVILRIYRDKTPLSEENIYTVFKVELVKRTKKGLGVTIVSKDVGVSISDLLKGGAAEHDGRLRKGDIILDVNGENLRGATQEHVATTLKRITGKVVLTVGRLKTDTGVAQPSPSQTAQKDQSKKEKSVYTAELWKVPGETYGLRFEDQPGEVDEESIVVVKEVLPRSPACQNGNIMIGDRLLSVDNESLGDVTAAEIEEILDCSDEAVLQLKREEKKEQVPPSMHNGFPASSESDLQAKEVILKRGPTGLGFTIVGGKDCPVGSVPIMVRTIFPGGSADKSGELHVGDQIIAINGHSLVNATHLEAKEALKASQGSIVLRVISSEFSDLESMFGVDSIVSQKSL